MGTHISISGMQPWRDEQWFNWPTVTGCGGLSKSGLYTCQQEDFYISKFGASCQESQAGSRTHRRAEDQRRLPQLIEVNQSRLLAPCHGLFILEESYARAPTKWSCVLNDLPATTGSCLFARLRYNQACNTSALKLFFP